MNKILKLITVLLSACSPVVAQTVISNVYVQSSTATTATIVWTTSTPANSQIKYGYSSGSLQFSNNTNFSLVTSHSMTLPLLNPSQPYFFAVVSTDNSGIPATSSTRSFALCGQPLVPVSGTVNFAYGNGSYTLTFNPPSGSSGPYTICGQSVTTPVTGTLNTSGSFTAIVADSLKVTPGPGTWTIAINGAGSIGAISISSTLSSQTQDISSLLQTAAVPVGLTSVTATGSTCNPAWVCAASGSVINPGATYALPAYALASGKVLSPSNIGVDVTGNNLLLPSGGTITIPGCSGKVVAADGTGCVTAVGTVSGQTLNGIPKASGASALTGPSALSDNGSVVSSSEPVSATRLTSTELGTSTAPVCPNGPGGALSLTGCATAGTVTASPQFSMFYQPNSGTAAAAQGDSNITTDGNGNFNALTGVFGGLGTGSVASATIAGIRYASRWGDGSTNGIASAFAGASSYPLTVTAGPAYPQTEQYGVSGGLGPAVNQTHMIDQRNGGWGDYYRNPAINPILPNNVSTPWVSVLQSDALQSAPTGTNASTRTMLWEPYIYCAAPGMSLGNPGFGPSGWTQCGGIDMSNTIYQSGLAQPFTINGYKAGTGDFANYLYHYSYGGAVSASDQGSNFWALNGGENNTTLLGTVATGGAGATTVTVNCTTDCLHPGDGRYLMKLSAVSTGVITAKVAPSGLIPGNYTVDQTYTPSSAWGTMNGNCAPNVGSPFGTGGTSITCNVTMLSSTFQVGDHVCFGGTFWEQAVLTGATGTTITASLRHQHASGTRVMANGPCGQVIDMPVNDVTVSGTTMHFPFPLLGATGANTLVWTWFNRTSITGVPTGNFFVQQFAATNLNNIGGLVYFTASAFTLATFPYMSAATITISGATISAYNGACTNLQPVLSVANGWQCTQSSSIAAGNSTSGTVAFGTTAFGNAAYSTYYASEVLDVQSYGTNPPQVCPSNLCTFTLEPNPAVTWTNGDAVELAHHYANTFESIHQLYQVYNPTVGSSTALNLTFQGNAINGGNPAQGTSFALQKFVNLNANSLYNYHGGTLNPPGGIMFANGLYNYGLAMINAPDPLNSSAIFIGCPVSGCTDKNYSYNLISASGNGATTALQFRPAFNELSLTGANIVLGSDLGKQVFRDNVTYSPLVATVGNTPTASTAGGTLADSTQYCYTVVATNGIGGAGRTAQSTEKCVTTGTSSGNNSVTFTWARDIGAGSYMVCGRTTGAELLMVTLNGINSTTFVDTGAITPSGACQTTDTSTPNIIGPASIQLASSSTAFLTTLKAPASIAASYIETLPETATVGSLVDKLAGATVVGDVVTFSNVTGRILDSGTLLTALAPKASPALTGTPTAPTQAAGDTSTDIATDAFVYASTSKAVTCGTTTTCSNTAQASPRIVHGNVALTTGSAVVGSMTAWTATTSFDCTGTDKTALNPVQIVNTSTTSITITGTGSDVISYVCAGN